MAIAPEINWQNELGIEQRRPTEFFSSKDDLRTAGLAVPQAHVLRRAFDLLSLDGILCAQSVPLVYFKWFRQISADQATRLHRKFWNHGAASVLVLLSPNEVQVYSALVRPASSAQDARHFSGLIEKIEWASAALREFIPSIESGEYFRRHARSFNPENRVDHALLDNLQATRDQLMQVPPKNVDLAFLDALLCRTVFTCYLFDREVIGPEYLGTIGTAQYSSFTGCSWTISPSGGQSCPLPAF